MNEEEIRRIVQDEIQKSLGDYSKMSLEVERTIARRLGGLVLTTSSKGATSENQAVDENGVATYNVLKPPDAFAEISVAGTTIYIPYFT